jgi:hypothetical protein
MRSRDTCTAPRSQLSKPGKQMAALQHNIVDLCRISGTDTKRVLHYARTICAMVSSWVDHIGARLQARASTPDVIVEDFFASALDIEQRQLPKLKSLVQTLGDPELETVANELEQAKQLLRGLNRASSLGQQRFVGGLGR